MVAGPQGRCRPDGAEISFAMVLLQICRADGAEAVRENSPAIHGWEYGQSYFPSPARDGREFLSSLTGL